MASYARLVAFLTSFNGMREAGQTLVEYGLLLALLAMAAFAALGIVGADVKSLFTTVATQFQNVSP